MKAYSEYPLQSDAALPEERFEEIQEPAFYYLPDGIIIDASNLNYIDTMGIQILKLV